jgi:hypothetical protein
MWKGVWTPPCGSRLSDGGRTVDREGDIQPPQRASSFSVIGPKAAEQTLSSVASESGGRSGMPENATRRPVQKPQRPRVDRTLIYETAI